MLLDLKNLVNTIENNNDCRLYVLYGRTSGLSSTLLAAQMNSYFERNYANFFFRNFSSFESLFGVDFFKVRAFFMWNIYLKSKKSLN